MAVDSSGVLEPYWNWCYHEMAVYSRGGVYWSPAGAAGM
jgi:hypothetical protein